MRLFLLVAASLLLAWQATMAVAGMVRAATTRAAVSWQQRWCATTDERMRRALGADAELLFALRGAAPAGTLLITQKVEGRVEDIKSVADFERLSARNGLLLQLTTLLYPDPFLLAASNPMQTVEDLTRQGRASLLCVLAGDATPGERAGWSRVDSPPLFQLWRFQKG